MNNISRHCRMALLTGATMMCTAAMAQVTQVHGTVSDDFGPLMGATICEIDATGRIIESTITDMNGNFSMKVKNDKDKLRISFVGLTTQTFKFDKTTYDVKLESKTTLQEVTIQSKKRMNGNNLPIPEREISFASQSISTKEFEGLGITSIDEALQGRIAGLDIVGNSGSLGSGSTMRLRGSGSLSTMTNANPLIVVDGNIREVDLSNFDTSTANEEQFAELLNVNTEDIASINVLKDASATAIYGSQGGNGVIELTTKRGSRGKPKVSYSGKITATYQPKGMDLLSGDDYTMLMKEAYFNPLQNDAASNIKEINYDKTFSEYEQYNNNTDWLDAVTRLGIRQNHFLTVSGGGEKATFRISGGFDHETGTAIEDKMRRLSTRVNLDYNVSERIRVQTNFALTYTQYNHNYDNLYGVALIKMPNMGIYEQDPITGANTGNYYNMMQSGSAIGSSIFEKDQRTYVNPVASAHLAKNDETKYDITPELVLNYELLGMDEDHHRLTWKGQVYMNIFNNYNYRFFPDELVTTSWSAGHNSSYEYSSKSVNFVTKHTLTFIPSFTNKDHTFMAMGRFELRSGSSSNQSTNGIGLPSGGIESPNAGGRVTGLGSGYGENRAMYFTLSTNYSYKSRYTVMFNLRADGTTTFGPDKRWGYFPSISGRWNVIDEPFMETFKGNWLSMLSVRPSWGIVGSAPHTNYLYTSKYGSTSQYMGMNAMVPLNLRLTNLRWEKVTSFNLGFDLGFLNDRLTAAFEVYNSTRDDMLMGNYRIPSSSGFYSLAYSNTGKLRNTGWEFRVNTNKIIKKGNFSLDLNANFGNNRSTLLEMDPTVLSAMNSTYNNGNREVLSRVQLNNPLNSIYGFRSKGVYMYQYETIKDMPREKQQAFLDAGNTAPVALNADGQIIYDDNGDPIQMMFNYTNDGTGKNYKFKGGDAIYEDVNNDGQINSLDIVYLGSSLPKLTGGFGLTANYGDFRLSAQFTYRVGVDILNLARLDAEAMVNNNNQSQAVNYRWRKEGDVTTIPRAMYGANSNYNTLISDRFVEDGSYLRCSYIQLSYALRKKQLKALGLNKISFYASANNPFVFTNYTGVDPDISASGYAPAQDNGKLPRVRSFTFGMTVDF